MDTIGLDLRFAARSLRRSPGFTAAAVLTLALGIGATTTVFSVVYGIVFRPLPFPNADRLVRIVQVPPQRPQRGPARPRTRAGLSPDQIAEWRATSRSFSSIGYFSPHSAALTGSGSPIRLNGAAVTPALFRALGVGPIFGRLLADEDEQPGNERVIILGHDAWRGRFGASPDVVGRSISINERSYRVVGVMPEGFGFPSLASTMTLSASGEMADAPEFWIPLVARPRPAGPASGGMTLVRTFALLRRGVTLEEAAAEASTLMPARLNERWPIELVNARVEETRAVRPTLLVFLSAVLAVLFIACVNVVNLLLARASTRRHELAIRRALGASAWQLGRYAVAEGVIIGAAGGALGCALAFQCVALFRALPPFLLPRMADVRVDGMVLALASAVSIAAGILVGTVAAVRSARQDLEPAATAWRSGTTSAGRLHRPARALLVAEVAAGVVLLAGAGLLLNSFVRLTSVDRGFDPQGVFTFSVSLPPSYEASARQAFHDRFARGLRALPDVTALGAADYMPGRGSIGFKTVVDGEAISAPVGFNTLTPGVFETLGIPLRGRDFTAADRTAQASVAIVNEAFASRFFPARDPIGQHVGFQDWPSLEIVGVAGDTRTADMTAPIDPGIYLPQQTDGSRLGVYVVRASRPSLLAAAVRAAAEQVGSNAVIYDATTMEALLARSVASPKLYSATATGFAIVAVVLAALGLYGVLSYSVGSRSREFGIRIALGASDRHVVGGVIREAAWSVLPGVALGVLAALYASRFLEALLFGVEPGDPATIGAVAALFLIVGAIACYVPARRATRVDPVVALRSE